MAGRAQRIADRQGGRGRLLERLLGLFSVQKLALHFGSTEKTRDAIIHSIIENFTAENIVDFAYLYHSTTKHHVHLFEHSARDLRHLPADALGLPTLAKTENRSRRWFYLLDLPFTVYLRDPLETTETVFPWPIKIICDREFLEVDFTIMEKRMAARFDPDRLIKVVRGHDESTIREQLLPRLELPELRPLDFNRGIKSLWNDRIIDAPSVQFKKARSTAREAMDGEYLIRRDAPEVYQELVDKPLFKTSFKWVEGDGLSIDHFAVDPSEGIVTFGTFSDLERGAEHVVREILRRN